MKPHKKREPTPVLDRTELPRHIGWCLGERTVQEQQYYGARP